MRQPLTISVPEAAKRLGLCAESAYSAAKRGDLPVIRIGKRVMVPVAKLNEMLGIKSAAAESTERK